MAYERVCVLFNIGALQSAVAASQSLESDEGLKTAAKLFQQAAGIFAHLKANVMVAIHQEPTPDLNPETLNALSSLMLAQAQEIFARKAIQGKYSQYATNIFNISIKYTHSQYCTYRNIYIIYIYIYKLYIIYVILIIYNLYKIWKIVFNWIHIVVHMCDGVWKNNTN